MPEPLTNRIENLLAALTPEVSQTIGPSLLRESLEEIRRLEACCTTITRMNRNDQTNPTRSR